MKPRLLDLFCGAGGAAVGYHRAGFDVVGVDIEPQPNYPFEFTQADIMAWVPEWPWIRDVCATDFDAVHASPPCQFYANLSTEGHLRSIPPTRDMLDRSGLPYVIENIEHAAKDMLSPVRLCGSSFGLGVRRHRLFETNFPLMVYPCWHGGQGEVRGYYGANYGRNLVSAASVAAGKKPLYRGTVEEAEADMGIDWMTWDELREAIPPAYTEFIGTQLMAHLQREETPCTKSLNA